MFTDIFIVLTFLELLSMKVFFDILRDLLTTFTTGKRRREQFVAAKVRTAEFICMLRVKEKYGKYGSIKNVPSTYSYFTFSVRG